MVEFKEKAGIDQTNLIQVYAYVRDIAHYHQQFHNREVHVLLVLTESNGNIFIENDALIISPDCFARVLIDICKDGEKKGLTQKITPSIPNYSFSV